MTDDVYRAYAVKSIFHQWPAVLKEELALGYLMERTGNFVCLIFYE